MAKSDAMIQFMLEHFGELTPAQKYHIYENLPRGSGWRGTAYHVYPVAEEKHHDLTGIDCICSPGLEEYERGVVVTHHRMDN